MTDTPHDGPTGHAADGPRPDPGVIDAADLALLADLRTAIAVHDPVPATAVAAARAMLTWRTVDAELAELQFDSLLDDAGVRGFAWPRQLSFEAREVAIEIEVDHDRIIGQVVPPQELDLTLVDAHGATLTARSDQVGHFRFTEVDAGTFRVSATLADGTVTTQWFTI